MDDDGASFSVDPNAPESESGPAIGRSAVPQAGPFPDNQTFLLHSRPGANRVIYLDFDGHTVTGTQWNTAPRPASIVAPAFSRDGSGSFSTAELTEIQTIWQRVSEDYAPWNVDVTTQDPGAAALERTTSGDLAFGTRALITNLDGLTGLCGTGCGGIAYIDTFDFTNSAQYQPAFIFPRVDVNGDGLYTAKDVAEAVTHEVGHNLGLVHDSLSSNKGGYYEPTGLWGPIMGSAFNTPVSQFSKGEYANSWNQTAGQNPVEISPRQDDLAQIGGPTGGLALLADDHGSLSSASTLGASPWSTSGVITSAADADGFTFTAATAGQLHVDVDPAAVGPNLDVRLQLFTSPGNAHVATSSPATTKVTSDVASGMDASLDLAIAAGSYTLLVTGVGEGDPATANGYSAYGSIGRYTLTGSFTGGGPATVPQPPTGVSVVRSGTTATVSFSAGPNGGSAVTQYYALCSSSDGGTGRAGTSTTVSPIAVLKLTAGKTYTCKVRAMNAVGWGGYSAPSSSFLVTTVPQPPTGVSVVRSGTTATVSFSAGPNGGSAVTQYYALCSSSDGGTGRAGTSTTVSPIAVLKLTAGKTYTCKVRAMNAVGWGGYSAPSSSFLVTTVPQPPTGVSVVRSGTTATVSFSAGPNGGSAVTQYYALCSSSDGGTGRAGTSTTVSPIAVLKLTAGKTYTCKVRAMNAVGWGAYSAPSSSFTT